MSFEKKFAALGKELDAALATTGTAEKPAKATGKKAPRKKAPAKKKEEGPTIDEVREALRRVIDEGGNDAATEILDPFGTKKVSGLDKDEYADVIEACETFLDDGGSDDDEDPTG